MAEGSSKVKQGKKRHSVTAAEDLSSPSNSKKFKMELKPEGGQVFLICSLKGCSRSISSQSEGHVEVRAGLPEGNISKFLAKCTVKWGPSGDATFHKECWKEVLKNGRARSQKRMSLKMLAEEQALVKEAARTAEFHDSSEQIAREAIRVAALLTRAKHCIVFTGAGISTSAGIGDYRGKGGKWTEMDREAVTVELSEVLKDTSMEAKDDGEEGANKDDGEERGVAYEALRPTYTHEALAKLLEMGIVKHIISQNGDSLHGLSGIAPENLSELHGNVFLEVCEKCNHRYYRPYYVMDDCASMYYEELGDFGKTDIIKPKHAVKCGRCGLNHRTGRWCEQRGCKGHLKDSIINFGDHLEEGILSNATKHAQITDLCLSLGSTMQVTPACELIEMGQTPLRLVIVNRQKTGFDELCYKKHGREQLGARVFGDCDHLMREVMKHLMPLEEQRVWEEKRGERMGTYNRLREGKE